MKKNSILTIRRIVVSIFLIIFGLIAYVNFRGNYLEYQELGSNYLNTFLVKQKYFYLVLIINAVIMYFIMYFVGRKIKKGLKDFFEEEKKEMLRLPNKSIAIVFSIIESIYIAIMFTPMIILCVSNTSFGETIPIFNLDISFFMFIEPLLKMGCKYFIAINILIILYTFAYYIFIFNKYFDGINRETLLKSKAMKTLYMCIRMIAIGVAFYILICSMDIVYDNFLTTDNNIKLAGAGIVDSTVKYVGYNILSIVFLFSIFKAVNSLKNGKQTKIIKDLAIVPIYLVFLFIIIVVFDIVFVKPNEFDKEKNYIEYNMLATKKAYAIECDKENLIYSGTLDTKEVENNAEIINNSVIVDKQAVLDTLKENQTETGYYTYKTANLSQYDIDGKKELVYVSPREIVNNRRTYNSKTYEYTHGYGLIFTSATKTNENGEIEYVQNDINGKENKINIKTPQIYYGLETNGEVVTNAKNQKEFDYLVDGKEYESDYTGKAGLLLNFWDRLILGIKQKNLKLAFSNSVTSKSNVLINRNILKRAKLALPDVYYDQEPYTVVDSDGDIYWIIDAYTISDSYPYSTYTEIEHNGQKRTINYIRNSIKVIINAYDGEIKYYITDRTDPIAMAYRKVYPEIFQDLDSTIPKDIQGQFIYPRFLYKVQATMLEEYHNTKADVLYRSDDTWEKVTFKSSQTSKKKDNFLDAYYTTIEDNKIGLIQMYSTKGKQNINAYLIGTVEDGKNTLNLKILNSDTNIIGPSQLENQIIQDAEIKDEVEKLTVTGAKITKNMIIVPVENTLLYVETIYQTMLNENNLPKLKKVVVASGNKIAIGNNLEQAIQKLVSQSASEIELNNTDEIDGLIDIIIKANDNLTESINSKNLELMGSDIQKLQELINSLKKKMQNQKEDEKTNVTEENTNETTIIDTNN